MAHRLGLAPESFWRLNLVEWQAIWRARDGAPAAPPTRAELTALLDAFPD